MGTQGGLRGAQFDHQPPSCMRSVDQFQDHVAPLGVSTLLPFKLTHQPRSAASVVLFAGEVPTGAGEIQRQGVDYSVDIEARTITWLATARKALNSDSVIIVRYFRRRPSVSHRSSHHGVPSA